MSSSESDSGSSPSEGAELRDCGKTLASELERILAGLTARPAGRRRPPVDEHDAGGGWDEPPELGAVERALDELQAFIELAGPTDMERLLERVSSLRSMAEAAEAAAIQRMERTNADVDAGYRTPTAAVKRVARAKHGDAARRVGVAQKVRDMPLTWAAWESGSITESHVARLCQAFTGHRRGSFLEAEAVLVEAALRCTYTKFCTVVAHFEQMTEPDIDDWDDREREKRSARLEPNRRERGGGTLEATFDAVDYTIFTRNLADIERELFEADWAEAVAELGERNVTLASLGRTPAQRRLDALVEMSQRACAMPPGARKPRPSIVVHIGYAAFETELKRRVGAEFQCPDDSPATLADGTPISPGRALALAVEGEIRRLVFDAPDVRTRFGRAKRFADGALREMIEARDRHCQGPGCDIASWRCQVDHIVDWQHDGETNGEDLELKCPWHNGRKSQYQIHTDPVTGRATWRRRRSRGDPTLTNDQTASPPSETRYASR